jgi:hypothetical protein
MLDEENIGPFYITLGNFSLSLPLFQNKWLKVYLTLIGPYFGFPAFVQFH